jgi:putative phage-type endonuclease
MWVDRGIYWEHGAPQNTQAWLEARRGRVNGSETGALAGESNFETPEQTGKYISGIEEKQFSEKSQMAMNHGHKWESTARIWYQKKYNLQVIERGTCVSKSDYRIASSVDGDIVGTSGVIEIKCPQKMYKPIINFQNMKKNGWQPPENYHQHIWTTHYCQMQQAMFVLGKTYCDYIVYSVEDRSVYTQRILFDPIFWKNHYEKVIQNYEKYVTPYLKKGYPIIPKSL